MSQAPHDDTGSPGASAAHAAPPGVAGEPNSLSARLQAVIAQAIADAGGWLPFDRYMAMALYQPGLGYYANAGRKFGWMPASGSDFVTAPELSPLFGRALAAQVAQGLQAVGADTVLEFGAGSGALAEQLLATLDADLLRHYRIVDLSGVLRARQAERLARFGDRVQWLDRLPGQVDGVLLGNEVLDAMPVQLLHWDGARWLERGVALDQAAPGGAGFAWADRPTERRPPLDGAAAQAFAPGTVTEVHPQAEAFIRTVAGVLRRGLALFIDYGFPEAEYYHPQRTGGTLMCHRGHRSDDDPLADPGLKDITAHVNFTGIALAGQQAGLDVAGYTSQARLLLNCGLLPLLQDATLAQRAAAQKLVTEHEMGELFKAIAFTRGWPADLPLLGFAEGDRTHRL